MESQLQRQTLKQAMERQQISKATEPFHAKGLLI